MHQPRLRPLAQSAPAAKQWLRPVILIQQHSQALLKNIVYNVFTFEKHRIQRFHFRKTSYTMFSFSKNIVDNVFETVRICCMKSRNIGHNVFIFQKHRVQRFHFRKYRIQCGMEVLHVSCDQQFSPLTVLNPLTLLHNFLCTPKCF